MLYFGPVKSEKRSSRKRFQFSSKYVLKSKPKAFSTSVYKVSSKYAKTSVVYTGAHLVLIAIPFTC